MTPTNPQILASLGRFSATMQALAPVIGGFERPDGTVGIEFRPEATAQQQSAANAAAASFDWSAAAQAAWQDARNPDRTALRTAASNAITNNTTYLAIVSPTNAQRFAQLDALTQQMNRVIKYLADI